MDVFGSSSDATFLINGKGLWINRFEKLLFIGGSNNSIAVDASAHEHDGTNGPVVFSITFVIVRGAPHLALHNNYKFFADPQLFRTSDQIINAIEKLWDQLHLVSIIFGVAVELGDR